jgi:alpha-amylase
MPAGRARERALGHLLRGQSNDSYWHGLFGGLYLADLRVAALRELIAAQDLADGAAGDGGSAAATTKAPAAATTEVADLDADGRVDVLLADRGQVVTVDLGEGAGIGAWDIRAVRHPVTAVLRRRPEAYHAALRKLGAAAPAAASAPATIHELVVAKEAGLADHLRYDDHERRFGLVRVLAPDSKPDQVAAGTGTELGDFVAGAFDIRDATPGRLVAIRDGTVRSEGRLLPVSVEKTIRLSGDRRSPGLALAVSIENRSQEAIEARFGLEMTTMLLGGGGNPAAWWEVGERKTGHDGAGTASGVGTVAQGNDVVGITIRTTVQPQADAWWSPVETVSNSEAGFERSYQGSQLLLSWRRELGPGEHFEALVQHVVITDRDLTAEP